MQREPSLRSITSPCRPKSHILEEAGRRTDQRHVNLLAVRWNSGHPVSIVKTEARFDEIRWSSSQEIRRP